MRWWQNNGWLWENIIYNKKFINTKPISLIKYYSGNGFIKNNTGEESLEEGMLVKVNEVIGEIDENDKIECDF